MMFRSVIAAVFLFVSLPAVADTPRAETEMVKAAHAWLDASEDEGDTARFRFSARERLNWHFFPRSRKGKMIGDMTDAEKDATRNLVRATLSSQGVIKAYDIMRLEAVLAEIEGSSLSYRNPEGYYVSIFGDPGIHPWGWRLEGHHLSINVTVPVEGEIAITPYFAGTNPAVPPPGAAISKRIQYDEMILGLRMAQSLNAEQFKTADLGTSPGNVVAGPRRGNVFGTPKGIAGSALNAGQRSLLLSLIAAYVGQARDEIGASYMARAEETLDATHFAWAGEISDKGAFYYRIHGPRILIEFDNTRGGNHIHALWRDPKNDFGRDVLMEHYRDTPHSHTDWP